jgi:hypothetical protein
MVFTLDLYEKLVGLNGLHLDEAYQHYYYKCKREHDIVDTFFHASHVFGHSPILGVEIPHMSQKDMPYW